MRPAVYDPDGNGSAPARLTAAGKFNTAGGMTVNNIAMWDGAAWQALGSGVNGQVHALTLWTPPGSTPTAAHVETSASRAA